MTTSNSQALQARQFFRSEAHSKRPRQTISVFPLRTGDRRAAIFNSVQQEKADQRSSLKVWV